MGNYSYNIETMWRYLRPISTYYVATPYVYAEYAINTQALDSHRPSSIPDYILYLINDPLVYRRHDENMKATIYSFRIPIEVHTHILNEVRFEDVLCGKAAQKRKIRKLKM